MGIGCDGVGVVPEMKFMQDKFRIMQDVAN